MLDKMIWVHMLPLSTNTPELKTARKLLGKDKIIGVSVNTVQEAEAALSDGADYLGSLASRVYILNPRDRSNL